MTITEDVSRIIRERVERQMRKEAKRVTWEQVDRAFALGRCDGCPYLLREGDGYREPKLVWCALEEEGGEPEDCPEVDAIVEQDEA